jgi:hypothetical protein
MLLVGSLMSYLNDNGSAFSFFASLLLAGLTGAYVLRTSRLAASQHEAARITTEPVLIPSVSDDDGEPRVTVKNARAAVASGVRLYTGIGRIAKVREPPTKFGPLSKPRGALPS